MSAVKSTQYIGVTFDPQAGYWQANIQAGESRWLGYFDDAEDAAMAYDAEARRLHGPDAETNFPKEMWREPNQNSNRPNRQREKRAKASRFIGVYRHADKWRAALYVGRGHTGRRCLSLGYSADELEAARAYDQAARQYRGSQATLNFPART